ncbi:Uncharacterised protein [Mycolicibacterium phlei]|nr:Uncharacterised protein [Mycolicibacterium phlei]
MERKQLTNNGLADYFSAWAASRQGDSFARFIQSAGEPTPEEVVVSAAVDRSQGQGGASAPASPSRDPATFADFMELHIG